MKRGTNMDQNIALLKKQIDLLRDELDSLLAQEEVKYEIVLNISQWLDDLIVLYVKTKKRTYTSGEDISIIQ